MTYPFKLKYRIVYDMVKSDDLYITYEYRIEQKNSDIFEFKKEKWICIAKFNDLASAEHHFDLLKPSEKKWPQVLREEEF